MVENERINQLLESLKQIHVKKEEDRRLLEEIKQDLANNAIAEAMEKLQMLNERQTEDSDETQEEEKPKKVEKNKKNESNTEESTYPEELQNDELERTYIGLLLNNPKSISMYYFVYEDCLFDSEDLINIYKGILFTEGAKYSSEEAKRNFNFGRVNKEIMDLKEELKYEFKYETYDFEKIYTELKKLFILRKRYRSMPIKETQDKIAEIRNYSLYDSMSAEEVEAAINQVTVTGKFKQAILNANVTDFLVKGQNELTSGLDFPFPILSRVFKGIRKGETMAFAMPSNSGKSRFTINLIANIAFVHKKKVLVISNEMSEEKMKLCLITTILNNPEIQKLHGQDIVKSEGELLEFKFRPDNPKDAKIDKNGFIIQNEKETREQFIKRLSKISTEFNKTVKATEWLNKQLNNCIYFINITDHTNDELKKVITNLFYCPTF